MTIEHPGEVATALVAEEDRVLALMRSSAYAKLRVSAFLPRCAPHDAASDVIDDHGDVLVLSPVA